ncbi:hypothetical protein RDWZM_008472 [Blomia tropicalis]|uniref:F-box domain-containing protein n=1 Tax=Blomia tropicalis TaxID=40697 RepID=A0A9Q0RKD3_BLOTA|nr:hypothetical protein RDWZM_008472 [Blomia tropicalis]
MGSNVNNDRPDWSQSIHCTDMLMHIFKHLSLRDCLKCRTVCKSWHSIVDQHFRMQTRFEINHCDIVEDEDNLDTPNMPFVYQYQLYSIDINHILHYRHFAQALSMFPNVRHFKLTNHPMNDIFISLVVVLLPRVNKLDFRSCSITSSTLSNILHQSANQNQTGNPLWNIINRFYHPKHLQDNERSIDNFRDILLQITTNDHLNEQLQHHLRNATQTIESKQKQKCTESFNPLTLNLTDVNKISTWGYRLIVDNYCKLTQLSLTNCGLTEDMATVLLKELHQIKTLDVADNEHIEGHCFQYLAETCESLCAGSYNLQVSIRDLLSGIVRSNKAKNLIRLELTGYISGDLHQLEQLPHLECLILHYYCDRVGTSFISLHSIAQLTKLRALTLEQEYCYEERSLLNWPLLRPIVENCKQLERLEILGEYGWFLQLDDQSLISLTNIATNLRHLTLIGNSLRITDRGIASLVKLETLETLNLTSFDGITDQSIRTLVTQLKHLKRVTLRDNCQLTTTTLDACADAARANPHRTLNVHIDEKQLTSSKLLFQCFVNHIEDIWYRNIDPLMNGWKRSSTSDDTLPGKDNEPMLTSAPQAKESFCERRRLRERWPTNLNVVIDENLRQVYI